MEIEAKNLYEYTHSQQESHGPVTGSELQSMAAAGELSRVGTSVRAAGDVCWEVAGRWKRLFAGPPDVPQVAAVEKRAEVPPAVPPGATPYPYPTAKVLLGSQGIKRASFPLYFIVSVAALTFTVTSFWFVIDALGRLNNHYFRYTEQLLSLSAIGSLISFVMALLILSKGWRMVQYQPNIHCSPRKAVGFLFIPLFNFFWAFVVWPGWVSRYRNQVEDQALPNSPKARSWPFIVALLLTVLIIVFRVFYELAVTQGNAAAASQITLCLIVFQIFCTVIWWVGIWGYCRATNYLVDRKNSQLLEEDLRLRQAGAGKLS